jgi:hypothetical protein
VVFCIGCSVILESVKRLQLQRSGDAESFWNTVDGHGYKTVGEFVFVANFRHRFGFLIVSVFVLVALFNALVSNTVKEVHLLHALTAGRIPSTPGFIDSVVVAAYLSVNGVNTVTDWISVERGENSRLNVDVLPTNVVKTIRSSLPGDTIMVE